MILSTLRKKTRKKQGSGRGLWIWLSYFIVGDRQNDFLDLTITSDVEEANAARFFRKIRDDLRELFRFMICIQTVVNSVCIQTVYKPVYYTFPLAAKYRLNAMHALRDGWVQMRSTIMVGQRMLQKTFMHLLYSMTLIVWIRGILLSAGCY